MSLRGVRSAISDARETTMLTLHSRTVVYLRRKTNGALRSQMLSLSSLCPDAKRIVRVSTETALQF